MSLNLDGIKEYQQNREPYLMIDFANEIVPGVSAKGYKDLNLTSGFLKCTGQMTQICQGCYKLSLWFKCVLSILTLPGNKGKVVYLTSANNLKFIKNCSEHQAIY